MRPAPHTTGFTLTLALSHQGRGDFCYQPKVSRRKNTGTRSLHIKNSTGVRVMQGCGNASLFARQKFLSWWVVCVESAGRLCRCHEISTQLRHGASHSVDGRKEHVSRHLATRVRVSSVTVVEVERRRSWEQGAWTKRVFKRDPSWSRLTENPIPTFPSRLGKGSYC